MTQARFWAIFSIDTSSLVTLDGLDRPPPDPPAYTPSERAAVWLGLEDLCQNGRLKLIKQVKHELKRWNPQALERLRLFKQHELPRTNNELRLRYQRLMFVYPAMLPRDPRFDPADPGWSYQLNSTG
ncbi:MAG: hypothetical protein WD904_09565 [Dehalococcoidia bacterium]